MLVVVVTGGIGSGKSTAVARFQKQGAAVIDTDVIARELVEHNPTVLNQIIERFGPDILDVAHKLNRKKLRERIFTNTADKQALQDILHPLIYEQALQQIEQLKQHVIPYCLLVIPLFVEYQRDYPHDRILVIDCDEQQQIERASRRDRDKVELIQNIIAHQASREQRLAIADDVIENNADIASLEKQVDALHHKYLKLSQD